MTIRFIEAHPEIFEYPSETSLLDDNNHSTNSAATNSSSLGHAVPSLSGEVCSNLSPIIQDYFYYFIPGSILANYTPKSAFQVEEFQLGLKPSTQPVTNATESTKQTEETPEDSVVLEEAPIQFSAGTNSDILF